MAPAVRARLGARETTLALEARLRLRGAKLNVKIRPQALKAGSSDSTDADQRQAIEVLGLIR